MSGGDWRGSVGRSCPAASADPLPTVSEEGSPERPLVQAKSYDMV